MGVLYANVNGSWEPILSGTLNLANADARYVNIAGDTMTGMLTLPATNPTAANHAVRKGWADTTYVNVSGDTMTGPLHVSATATAMPLRVTGAASGGYIGYYEGATRRGYTGHYPDGSMSIASDTGHVYVRSGSGYILFQDGAVERARLDTNGVFMVGKTSVGTDDVGADMRPDGQFVGTIGDSAASNLYAKHYGGASTDGTRFARFVQAQGTTLGSITQDFQAGVKFNTNVGLPVEG